MLLSVHHEPTTRPATAPHIPKEPKWYSTYRLRWCELSEYCNLQQQKIALFLYAIGIGCAHVARVNGLIQQFSTEKQSNQFVQAHRIMMKK